MIWQAAALAQVAAEKAKQIAPPDHSPDTTPYFLAALLFGALVGAAEIVSRYRSAPLRAIDTDAGYFYIAINAIASAAALFVVLKMNWVAGDQTDPERRLLLQTITASFAAIAFFRSSLFTLRVGDADVAIGPMSVLQALLKAADRSTDRVVARPRAEAVTRIMSGISFERGKEALPALCFSLMQNITLEERAEIRTAVDSLTASGMEDGDKAHNLGLTLMNLVGEEVLSRAVDILRRSIRAVRPRPSLSMLALIRNVDFQQDAIILLNYLMLVSGAGTQANLRSSLEQQITEIGALQILPTSRVFVWISILIAEFGEPAVESAMGALPANATPPVTPTPAAAPAQGPGTP